MRSAILLLSAGLWLGAPLSADAVLEGEALVKKSDCLTCHQASVKVVGPAYKDVAKKYKGDAGAVAKLVKKIRNGGSGVWGSVPMAPHPNIPEADAEKMVKWVLAGAPSSAPAPVAAKPTEVPAAKAANDEKKEAGAKDDKPRRTKKAKHHAAAGHGHGAHGEEPLRWDSEAEVLKSMVKQDCFGCHSGVTSQGDPDKKPWPSFKQIAERKGDAEVMVAKIAEGKGKLKWGGVPHPVYENLSKDAVAEAVKLVLAGKAVEPAKEGAEAPVDVTKMEPEEWMRKKSDCFTCHQVDSKVLGPSFKDVAKKYGDKDVAALVKKVKLGGSGVWGTAAMAAHPNAPDVIVEKAVRWVLSQK